jgi:hypothetical protein
MRLRTLGLAVPIATLLTAIPAAPAGAADGQGNFIIVGSFTIAHSQVTPVTTVGQFQALLSAPQNGFEIRFDYPQSPPIVNSVSDARQQLRRRPLAVMWQTTLQITDKRVVAHSMILVGSPNTGGYTFSGVPGVISRIPNAQVTNLALYEVVLRYASLIRAQQAGLPIRPLTAPLDLALGRAERLALTSSAPCLRAIRTAFEEIRRGGAAPPPGTTLNCGS